MKKQILFILIPFFLLSGCAINDLSLRHDVALSFDSERIAYDVVGNGKTTLIFIHGWSCDGRYWQKQIPVFAKKYQVITVDLAGHGHSSLNRSDFSMLSFANDVKAIIEKENIDRAILIGHSMGGGVIAEAARLMPEKVVGIVGVDTLQNVAERTPQSVVDEMTQLFEADFKTDNTDWLTSDIIEANLARWQVEDRFRLSKNDDLVGTSPVRHWTDSKIRCHLFTCVVAMTYLRRIELKMEAAGKKRSAEKIMDDMQHLHYVLSIKKGSRTPERRLETLSKTQSEVLSAFGYHVDDGGVLQGPAG